MEQIAVIKKTTNGAVVESRNMMLPKNIWENIVKNGSSEANVTWELRKVEPITVKPIAIIQEEIKEVSLIAEPKPEATAKPSVATTKHAKRK